MSDYEDQEEIYSIFLFYNKFHFNVITWLTHIIYNCPYNIQDIKYISDGSRLEVPTVASGIEPMLANQVHNIYPRLYDLGHKDYVYFISWFNILNLKYILKISEIFYVYFI